MDFIDYLESYLDISRASGGSQVVIHEDCPFCGASGGRIYVSVKKGVGICFKCSEPFGALKFVAAYEGVSRAQAAKLLGGSADRYVGLEGEEVDTTEPELWFPYTVPFTEEATAYIQDRGFSLDFCANEGMMFSPFDTQTAEKTYWTRNRIIMPIRNRAGEIVAWQGRDITGKSKIKYLFPPGFKGAEHMDGIHEVTPGQPVLLVEGKMDRLGWKRAGIGNVLATFGKKISHEQVLMLTALKPSAVYMAWDGDALFERYGFIECYGHLFNVRMVEMGEKDADERKPAELRDLLATAAGYEWEAKILAGLGRC